MDRGDLIRIPKNQILRGPDLLKPLPLDTKLFDNVSSSDSHSSELSGPFSDVVYTVEVESKRKSKQLYGKNLYDAFSFSPEFKTAIEQVKKEMIAENPDYLKTDSMIAVNPEEDKILEDKESEEILKIPDIDFEFEVEEEVEDKKKDSGKEKRKQIWSDEVETVFDTMSGYWRLLSVFDEFRISPPWYNAYAEGKEHWLTTKPIPPDVLEDSRKKCLNWLSKYFDKLQIGAYVTKIGQPGTCLQSQSKMKPVVDIKILPATSEDAPAVGRFMQKYFYPEEPLNSSINRHPDPDESPFLNHLNEGLCFKAVNLMEESEDNLAGVVINTEKSLAKKKNVDTIKDPKMLKVHKILSELDEKTKIWEVVNNENHFSILAVTVNKKYRGHGIGQKLVEESLKLAKSLKFKYASIECSSFYSARFALDIGFELLGEILYEEYLDENKEQIFKVENPHKGIMKMIKRL